MKDLITVVMVTSPIPSNPDTSILEETLASVRERLDSRVLIVADGVRKEQIRDRQKNYDAFLDRLTELEQHTWEDIELVRMVKWGHQANSAREALKHVRTPLVLFVEHDTPLTGEFDWEALTAAAQDDQVNLIRFHHEAQVLDVHQYLMLDRTPRDIQGAPLLRTVQWSQRPHLAKTTFYRDIINTYFGLDSRTMIEDVMHGVVDSAWRIRKYDGWAQFKLWMYCPEGNIKRSEHLDGREGDPKFDMYYEYEGHETPWGAPARTAGRTD